MQDLPFHDFEWPIVDKTLHYFADTEEGDVQDPLTEGEIRNIYALYDAVPVKYRVFSRQCLCFLLDHAPVNTTDREEICYFMFRPYLLRQTEQVRHRYTQLERVSTQVAFMDLFSESKDAFAAIQLQDNPDLTRFDSRAVDLIRIENIVSFENDIACDLIADPETYVPNAINLLQKFCGSPNKGIDRHIDFLQDKLLDLYSMAKRRHHFLPQPPAPK